MTIRHAFTNPKADGGDATVARPSDWNADHIVEGLSGIAFVGARYYHNTTQGGLGSSLVNPLNFNTLDWDTNSFKQNVGGIDRYVIPAGQGGKYLLVGRTQLNVEWSPYWKKNGSTYLGFNNTAAAFTGGIAVQVENLVAGDYVEFCEYHGSGTGTAGSATRHVATEVALVKLEPSYASGLAREFDYAQFTAPVSITATAIGSANTIVTGNAVTYDGSTTVMVEFFAPYIQPPTGETIRLFLFDGSTSLGYFQLDTDVTGSTALRVPGHGSRRLTPSAGSHTYSIRGIVVSGTGSVVAGAGGATFSDALPGFMRITEVVGVGGPSMALPWNIPIPVEMTPDATINTWSLVRHEDGTTNYANGGSGITNGLTSPAQNDEVAWDVVLAAGTWELTLHTRASTNVGIYTVSIDGTDVGTIDGYNATAGPAKGTISGITVATTGKKRLKFKMATKNASSSGYVGNPQAISLRRTA